MSVLVTGGTGFVGSALVRRLAATGRDVRCLVRRDAALPPGVTAVPGDLTRPSSLADALAGVTTVYHLAAATLVPHPLRYRANATGTANLARAVANEPTPPRVVYLSSIAALGPSPPDAPHAEDAEPRPLSYYGRSKLAGERAFRRVADQARVTVVRAPSVYGSDDPNTIKLVRTVASGLNVDIAGRTTRVAWVEREDLIDALLAAEARGAAMSDDPSSGVYHVAHDEQPSLAELGTMIAEILGRREPIRLPLPVWLFRFHGAVIDLWNAATGDVRLLTSDRYRDATGGSWRVNSDKASRELGFSPRRALREGFAAMIEAYRAGGEL